MKKISSHFLANLKSNGHRLTKTRIEIIDIMFKNKSHLAADEILGLLSKRHLPVNKTTVYREIEFLCGEGVINELHFDDRKKRYELAGREHHHHLICSDCKRVEDVLLIPEVLEAEKAQEEKIVKDYHFKIHGHCMEFFGLCDICANK